MNNVLKEFHQSFEEDDHTSVSEEEPRVLDRLEQCLEAVAGTFDAWLIHQFVIKCDSDQQVLPCELREVRMFLEHLRLIGQETVRIWTARSNVDIAMHIRWLQLSLEPRLLRVLKCEYSQSSDWYYMWTC